MKTPNASLPKRINFNKFGYYAVGLFVIAVLGFWPTYFSKFFNGTSDFNFYFHFHFALASLWIVLLIVQPILIKKKKLALHWQTGKLSFIIFFQLSFPLWDSFAAWFARLPIT